MPIESNCKDDSACDDRAGDRSKGAAIVLRTPFPSSRARSSFVTAWAGVALALAGVALATPCLGQVGQVGQLAQVAGPLIRDVSSSQESPGSSSQADKRGSVQGTVMDSSGAVVGGARVTLVRDGAKDQEKVTGEDGLFVFSQIGAGSFHIAITAAGFAPQTIAGVLGAGEIYTVPQITLLVASTSSDVQVGSSQVEIAEEQIKVEAKQRVFGAIPNFYVVYPANPQPLTSQQKFKLAYKFSLDPASFVIAGAIAGVQQANDDLRGYGQGAEGYAKRYGAAYGNFIIGTFIGNALLPSLFRQDPRYYYKGTGTKRSRVLYAIANSVVCRGDNGRWQANYSAILGSLAAGGISNLYYPARDRDGAALSFENAGIGIAAGAAANVLQEFLVRRLTPHAGKSRGSQP